MNEENTTSNKKSNTDSEFGNHEKFGYYRDNPKVEDKRAKIAEIRQTAKDLEKKQKNNN